MQLKSCQKVKFGLKNVHLMSSTWQVFGSVTSVLAACQGRNKKEQKLEERIRTWSKKAGVRRQGFFLADIKIGKVSYCLSLRRNQTWDNDGVVTKWWSDQVWPRKWGVTAGSQGEKTRIPYGCIKNMFVSFVNSGHHGEWRCHSARAVPSCNPGQLEPGSAPYEPYQYEQSV